MVEVQKSIYELIQEVRYELSQIEIKKSGWNPHLKFGYIELKDFVQVATKLFYEKGLCPVFSIQFDGNGVEVAVLKIVSGTEQVVFTVPTADSTASQNPIQNLGAKITYLRRYMYLIALDLVENDAVDAEDGEVKPQTPTLATPKQVELIKSLYDEENVQKMIEYYQVNSLDELTVKQASEAIARKKK